LLFSIPDNLLEQSGVSALVELATAQMRIRPIAQLELVILLRDGTSVPADSNG
jgi:hypothetical protein